MLGICRRRHRENVSAGTAFYRSNKKSLTEIVRDFLVLEKGLEPIRLSASEPKSDVSANFTTRAKKRYYPKKIFPFWQAGAFPRADKFLIQALIFSFA